MLHRRSVIRGGLAALGAFSTYVPLGALGQGKPLVKVRYNEVVRSLLYAPAYVAITKGYFKDAGLDVALTTANGGDKSMAALISGSADIALIGPETAIYVLNSDSSTKVRIFCGLTSTDGFMLVGRTKVDKFDWSMLKGKEILGFRPGSTPLLFLEEAMRMNGVDPDTDVKLTNNVAVPGARRLVARWPEPIRNFHRAGRLAARTRRQGLFPCLDRWHRRLCRLHVVHGDGQVHQRQSRGPAELDRRHLSGAEMDGSGVVSGDRQRDRRIFSRASIRKRWPPRPSAIKN